MAVACSSSPHIPILKSGLVINPISKSLVVKYSQAPFKKAPRFQIKCSIRNKVFEDQSNGIICYRDDSGEIICEGYDDGLVINPISKSLVVKYSQAPFKKAPRFQIKCSIRNKVFEDQSNGIICYRDDSGEIICEGYDDGPRLQQHTPRTACHPRDIEIFDLLLQQSRLQMVKGSGFNYADESVAVQKDFNCNGFNSFC